MAEPSPTSSGGVATGRGVFCQRKLGEAVSIINPWLGRGWYVNCFRPLSGNCRQIAHYDWRAVVTGRVACFLWLMWAVPKASQHAAWLGATHAWLGVVESGPTTTLCSGDVRSHCRSTQAGVEFRC